MIFRHVITFEKVWKGGRRRVENKKNRKKRKERKKKEGRGERETVREFE